MSVPSLKMTVTAERPPRDTERSSSRCGRPLSAASIGNVTARSTSIGEKPGQSVMTETCTVETSGTASIGRYFAAAAPPARSTTSIEITKKRTWMDRATMDASMATGRSPT